MVFIISREVRVNKILQRIIALLIACGSFQGLVAQNISEILISTRIENQTIPDALLTLSEVAHISIGFDASIFDGYDVVISKNYKNKRLEDVLFDILKETDVDFDIRNNHVLISKKTQDFFIFSGYVSEAHSGEKLIQATLIDQKNKVFLLTNDFGFFSVKLPQKTYHFEVSYVGFKTKNITQKLNKSIHLNINLEFSAIFQELVVNDNQFSSNPISKSVESNIHPFQIKSKIGKGGESDIIGYIQSQAGVQHGPDGLGGMNVRGGDADQNIIVLDDATIFQPYHTFGLFSIFNTEAIRHVNFYKNGFPAKFGGRLSSVLDIRTKEGNTNQLEYGGSISTLMTSITADIPIVKEKSAIFIAARRTHIDPWIQYYARNKKSENGEHGTTNYHFYDLNLKWHTKLTKNDRVYLSMYSGQDDYYDLTGFAESDEDIFTLVQDKEQKLQWGNELIAFRWNHIFNNFLFSNLTMTRSRYTYDNWLKRYNHFMDIDSSFQDIYQSKYQSMITDNNIKLDFNYYKNENNKLNIGIHFLNRSYFTDLFYQNDFKDTPSSVSFQKLNYAKITSAPAQLMSNELSLYIDNQYRINEKLLLQGGLRVNLFLHQGFWAWSPQYNVNFWWLIDDQTHFNISLSRMYQNLHALSASGGGLPSEIWVPATSRVKPKKSFQFSSSITKTWDSTWQISVSGYYKKMKNLIQYYETAKLPSIIENDPLFWEDEVSIGTGKAYGIEFLLSGKLSKWNANLNYTYSNSTRQFDGVNDGHIFPFIYDQPHRLNVNTVFHLNQKLDFYAAFGWYSGTPYTLYKSYSRFNPLSTDFFGYDSDNGEEGQASSINGVRLPDYQSLDIGIIAHWNLKKYTHKLIVGLSNMTNHKNTYFSYTYVDIFGEEADKTINKNTLPILPSIKYSIGFRASPKS